MDQRFGARGRRADEMLDVLAKLWSGELVEHHGTHYDFSKLEMNPPVTEPVPILVGGVSDAALARAARHDGWVSDLATTEELTGYRRRIDRFRADCGRSGTPFSMVASPSDAFDPDGYRRVEEVGVTDVLTMPWVFYAGFTDDLDAKIEGVYRFADDIIAKVG